jgi:hypothetical protein
MVESSIIIALIASSVVIISLVSKLIYSSKCKSIKCCGCEVLRDTANEVSLRHIIVDNTKSISV